MWDVCFIAFLRKGRNRQEQTLWLNLGKFKAWELVTMEMKDNIKISASNSRG